MSTSGGRGPVVEGSRLGRLLVDALGYTVCATDDQRLGRLIWLTYGPDDEWPVGLRVQPQGPGEATFSGSWEIPRGRVVSVLPARREVTVVATAEGPEHPRR